MRTGAIVEEDETVTEGSFVPSFYELYLFQLYRDYSQWTRTIHDYTAEFLSLADWNNPREIEDQQVARFLKGLKSSIWDEIGQHVVYTFKHAHNLALNTEVLEKETYNLGFYCKNKAEPTQQLLISEAIRNATRNAIKGAIVEQPEPVVQSCNSCKCSVLMPHLKVNWN